MTLGRQEISASNPQSGGVEPSHQTLAQELFFLGLYDEGVPEFAAGRSEVSEPAGTKSGTRPFTPPEKTATVTSQSDLDYTLARYALRGGLANGRSFWRILEKHPSDYV